MRYLGLVKNNDEVLGIHKLGEVWRMVVDFGEVVGINEQLGEEVWIAE